MRIVDIYRRRPEDGSVEHLARVSADGDQPAVFHYPNPEYRAGIELLIAPSVLGADGIVITAADGEAYVAALPEIYRGSRFWAEELIGDDGEDEGQEAAADDELGGDDDEVAAGATEVAEDHSP